MKLLSALTIGLGLFSTTVFAANDVVGIWETVEGKSHVEISKCQTDKYCGKITWLKEPNNDKGQPKTDINNQDVKLRERKILGIELLSGLEKVGANEWDDGDIYNPEDGNTYSSEMSLLDDNTLEVKGCVLFICKTQVWKRIK
ncbi:DUF2147 domain-containing protein [Sneathiella limimaris]|uniref:DUF2147 domain-containing protein n=1 Tax=Sneathiella limimaris TaxID=1964213 RepID=UPI00146F75A9|nr:DUF2147 domain-containing protein [Sneathiella limimaris]